MDVLFTKWWMHGLLRPLECGLLRNCASEREFMIDMKEVVKILKVVFYDKPVSDLISFTPAISQFVISSQYFLNDLGNLLKIT